MAGGSFSPGFGGAACPNCPGHRGGLLIPCLLAAAAAWAGAGGAVDPEAQSTESVIRSDTSAGLLILCLLAAATSRASVDCHDCSLILDLHTTTGDSVDTCPVPPPLTMARAGRRRRGATAVRAEQPDTGKEGIRTETAKMEPL